MLTTFAEITLYFAFLSFSKSFFYNLLWITIGAFHFSVSILNATFADCICLPSYIYIASSAYCFLELAEKDIWKLLSILGIKCVVRLLCVSFLGEIRGNSSVQLCSLVSFSPTLLYFIESAIITNISNVVSTMPTIFSVYVFSVASRAFNGWTIHFMVSPLCSVCRLSQYTP